MRDDLYGHDLELRHAQVVRDLQDKIERLERENAQLKMKLRSRPQVDNRGHIVLEDHHQL